MSPESVAEPVRSGDFQHTPFVHVLLELGHSRSDGTLVIKHSGRVLEILMRAGRPIAAGPLERGATLEQGLMPLCALSSGTFSLFAQDLIGQAPGFTRGAFDPVGFLRGASREHVTQPVVDALVDAQAGRPLRLLAGIDVRGLGLHGREAQLAELLRNGGQTVASICRTELLPAARTRRVLFFLLATGSAVPEGALGSTATSHTRMRAVSPARRSVAPGSTPNGAQSAPAEQASASGAPLPAWQQLALRRASSVPPRPSSRAPSVPTGPIAESPEQRIERLLRAGDVSSALELAREAAEEQSASAAAQAMLAWVLLQADPGPIGQELVDAVNRALRLDPEQPRGLYTKAMAYRRMGRERDALRYFQRTVRANPQHIDARRELRLAQMRGTLGKPAKKP